MERFFISYFLLMFFGFTGAHRFYLNRFYSGVFYLGTAGFFGIGVVMDFFMIPFIISDDIDREGGDAISLWLKLTMGLFLFLFFVVLIFLVTSILAFFKFLS